MFLVIFKIDKKNMFLENITEEVKVSETRELFCISRIIREALTKK